jgi:hypothetical protein
MRVYFYNEQITTYYITTEGKLYNSKTKNWLKGQISKNGYLTYNISIDGEKHRLYAHRMVAETFLPRIENKTQVNHKDGNKLNNSLDNLEWVTCKENINHAYENNLNNSGKPVYCFNENKELVCTYRSISMAAEVNHFNEAWLANQISREVKTLSHGFYWSFSEDNSFPTKELTGVCKPVGQYTVNGMLIEKYPSRNAAARKTGYDKKRIGECCNGKIKTYHGYVFKYI